MNQTILCVRLVTVALGTTLYVMVLPCVWMRRTKSDVVGIFSSVYSDSPMGKLSKKLLSPKIPGWGTFSISGPCSIMSFCLIVETAGVVLFDAIP